jgi:TonB family protein
LRLKNSILAEMNIDRYVPLVFSPDVSTPEVVGYIYQTMIFPEYTRQWSTESLQMALIHEAAHIKRHDTMRYLIGSIAVSLYWFNPLVWFCRKKLMIDADMVCDDFVLNVGFEPHSYATNLLEIAREIGQKRLVLPVGVHMSRKSKLEERLMSIMSNRRRKVSIGRTILIAGVILSAIIIIPLSGMQLMAQETKSKSTMDSKKADDTTYPKSDAFVKVDKSPEMVTAVTPEYPEDLKKQKIEGDVVIQSLVDVNGKVIKSKILKSSGNDELDKSALKAAKGCLFKPAVHMDEPVAIWISYKVSFSLDEK